MNTKRLDPEYIRSIFDYDSETGILRWKEYRPGIRGDRVAGTFDRRGYLVVKLDGSTFKLSRIVWAHYHGVWPENEIDHKDLVRHHNWIRNLREVTRSQNMMNSPIQQKSKSGIKGVTWFKQGSKWRADIRIDGDLIYLGLFSLLEEAAIARREAELLYFGDFA